MLYAAHDLHDAIMKTSWVARIEDTLRRSAVLSFRQQTGLLFVCVAYFGIMAIGKSKRKPKKGTKKKVADAFAKKEWYDIQAPSNFEVRKIGKTVVNKTTGTKYASEGLKGRVFKVSLADLNRNEEQNFKVVHLIVEDVQGDRCLTNYHGMSFTTDKLKSLVRKWQTLIEAHVDLKTTDGYTVRLFCIGFTKRRPNQVRKTSYAQSSQIRKIRKKMVEIMNREAQNCDLRQLFDKILPESVGTIGAQIERECQGIYPLQNVFIRKVKILKKPKFDPFKLMELHGEKRAEDTGVKA